MNRFKESWMVDVEMLFPEIIIKCFQKSVGFEEIFSLLCHEGWSMLSRMPPMQLTLCPSSLPSPNSWQTPHGRRIIPMWWKSRVLLYGWWWPSTTNVVIQRLSETLTSLVSAQNNISIKWTAHITNYILYLYPLLQTGLCKFGVCGTISMAGSLFCWTSQEGLS